MSEAKPRVVIGVLGPSLDAPAEGPDRWRRWRPTVDLFRHPELPIARFEMLHDGRLEALARTVADDVREVSPATAVEPHPVELADPWDFEEVYAALLDFARDRRFDPEREDYLVHMTTGTHVLQICFFLLVEARYLPARLVQTIPPAEDGEAAGTYSVIDLDLSRYDRLAARFEAEHRDALDHLKSGISTREERFNRMVEEIERVAVRSTAPILLTGPTGTGKTLLGRRIYELRRRRRLVGGAFVEVNCATLRGEQAMSALFGHVKGAFTGALAARRGLLKAADGGVLFLDEIGELGGDEQAMLLRALEEGTFFPLGSDREARSDFQLLCGTCRDLGRAVADGEFREDLYARVNLWSFELPPLADRRRDIPANLDYQLEQLGRRAGSKVSINRAARRRFEDFATSPEAIWPGNFRDFNAAVERMATLAPGGRIDLPAVEREIRRLRALWAGGGPAGGEGGDAALRDLLSPESLAALDPFDRAQLGYVLEVCRRCPTLSEAGRRLFAVSRLEKRTRNDADRLRKYLARFGLSWPDLQ